VDQLDALESPNKVIVTNCCNLGQTDKDRQPLLVVQHRTAARIIMRWWTIRKESDTECSSRKNKCQFVRDVTSTAEQRKVSYRHDQYTECRGCSSCSTLCV